MLIFTRFLLLLLNSHLISHVYAKEQSKSAVKWIQAERNVLVRLATPDLFYWDRIDEVTTEYPGAFMFNLKLSPDNRTLLLNDEPILPRAHPHVPAPLRAFQIGEIEIDSERRYSTNWREASVMDLDYYIDTPDTTSGTSIYNTKFNPRVRIDILRASIPTLPGYSKPLSSDVQEMIWVWLEDLSEHPPHTPYANIPLRISRVEVSKRWLNHHSEGTTTYRSLKSLSPCFIWSWLCADIDEYPYYEYIYRENFDQYGKKGSMRHFLTRRWANLVNLMGFWQAIVLLAVCGSMVLSPFVYAVFRGVTDVVDMYRKRMQEVDEWIADEEVEGLENDRYFEDFRVSEKVEAAEEKGSGKTSVEEPLPPPYSEEDETEFGLMKS